MIASTAVSFALQLADVRKTFPVRVMASLENNWLVFKDRLVAAFMRKELHYGHFNISRAEKAHSA